MFKRKAISDKALLSALPAEPELIGSRRHIALRPTFSLGSNCCGFQGNQSLPASTKYDLLGRARSVTLSDELLGEGGLLLKDKETKSFRPLHRKILPTKQNRMAQTTVSVCSSPGPTGATVQPSLSPSVLLPTSNAGGHSVTLDDETSILSSDGGRLSLSSSVDAKAKLGLVDVQRSSMPLASKELSKLAKRESLKVQKKHYRHEKKRAAKELLSALKDTTVTIIAD